MTLCVREMVLRAHREAGNESSLAFLERPPWSENITIPVHFRGSRRRREMTLCVPVEREISGFRFAYVALAVGAS